MTITEFLEARIAEDEARAVEARDWVANGPTPNFPWYGLPGDRAGMVLGGAHPLISAMSPARVLAECAAKRAIIAEHGLDGHSTKDYCETCADWWKYELGEGPPGVEYPCPTIRALAAVYSGHPDYQQEWAL